LLIVSPRSSPRTWGSTRWQTEGSHYKSPSAIFAAPPRVDDSCGD